MSFDEEDTFEDDISTPFGANEENKLLDKEVKLKEREVLKLRSEIEEQKGRAQTLQQHVKNVQQELIYTQNVYDARLKEVNSEAHMKAIAEREANRVDIETRKTKDEIIQLQDALNNYHNQIAKANDNIESIKKDLNWNQQELETWLEKVARVEEDASLIEKYSRADEARIKELNLLIEKITVEQNKVKKELDNEVTDTHAARLGLEKAGEAFRRLHLERQELLRLWEQTIATMQVRDKEIEKTAIVFQQLKHETATKILELKEKEEFLKQQQQNNDELDKQIEGSERALAKITSEVTARTAEKTRFQDETDTLRNTLARTSTELNTKKSLVTELRAKVKTQQQKLGHVQEEIVEKQTQLDTLSKKTLTVEEQARELEEMLRVEEQRNEALAKELSAMRESQFKYTQKANDLKRDQAALVSQVQGARQGLRNLATTVTRMDTEALSQAQIIYQQDFQTALLDKKLAKLQGKKSLEEQIEFDGQIKELKDMLEQQTQTHALLVSQTRKTEEDLRHAKRHHDKLKAEKASVGDKLNDIMLHDSSIEQELKNTTREKEELMVAENILRLHLRKLRGYLNQKADHVFSLEQQKLQLELAMEERLRDIAINKEMLTAQLKAHDENASLLNKELKERGIRIDQLKKKYDIVSSTIAASDGENHSQAYYVVKVAQEREELQNQGDTLDSRIRVLEKEVRALENTLQMMNGRNNKYRETLTKTAEGSREAAQKETLETQYRAAMDKFKHKRRQVASLEERVALLQNHQASVSGEIAVYDSRLADLSSALAGLRKELQEQEEKKQRALKTANKALTQYKESAPPVEGETLAERDFRLRHLVDFNNSVLNAMDEFVARNPDVQPEVNMLFDRAGVSHLLPGTRKTHGSQQGSETSSVTSKKSTTSVRSVRLAPETAADAVKEFNAKKGPTVGMKTFTVPMPSLEPTSPSRGATPSSRPATKGGPPAHHGLPPGPPPLGLSIEGVRPTSSRSVRSNVSSRMSERSTSSRSAKKV